MRSQLPSQFAQSILIDFIYIGTKAREAKLSYSLKDSLKWTLYFCQRLLVQIGNVEG